MDTCYQSADRAAPREVDYIRRPADPDRHTPHDRYHQTSSMKLFVVAAFCLIAKASCQGNLVDVAKTLGATTLLELATDAGLANTLATGGKNVKLFCFLIIFRKVCHRPNKSFEN